ncbi:MAG: bifunctional acetaldehyde-CoA/alcohol dehydrogenase [Eubacteriales bacterium]|nr:bifunctional acetaldehyde-CoA/alcohol dehydrogenase [Eubacteriales bacterium]MDD4390374.1 bifunctional acetaldehyde-CoA/alcohol dehydrogenase [Eubacteriales bacterium]
MVIEKTVAEVTDTINPLDNLRNQLAEMREAQKIFASFTQEQVDKIFFEAAMAANKAGIELAGLAVEETGMGIMEDKVIKNHYAAEFIYNAYCDLNTCGVIEDDPINGIKKIAEPMGIVGAVIPTTNPTSTTIFKILLCLKTRNAIMISPHPRAKNSTMETARLMNEAAVRAGAPQGIIGCIENPSIELSNALMKESDIILATGGPGMIKAAYSSGKPAIGVGAGNTPVILDETCDIKSAVYSIIHSKTFDNGVICASEQAVIAHKSIYKAVRDEFSAKGCHILNEKETESLRKMILTEAGTVNPKIVGQPAYKIAELAGFSVPENTKILIGEVQSVELDEPFAHEKLSPVLALYMAPDFDDALNKAEKLIADGGYGHTASAHIAVTEEEKLSKYYDRMKTCRILVNSPASHGAIGGLYNFRLAPSLTLGCGSYGGNSKSHNIGAMDLVNIKTVVERRDNMLCFRMPEKVYYKRGCLASGISDLKAVYKRKRAFIVTDKNLFNKGYTAPLTKALDEMGIRHSCFYELTDKLTIASAEKGVEQIRLFEPDVIIALGGGSVIDAVKIMRLMYEQPNCNFEDLSMGFIGKSVHTFPKLGEKAMVVAIPTSSGTGAEVTPFAIITDAEAGITGAIVNFDLMPDMAIVDTDFLMNQPKNLTRECGIGALAQAIEAYASIMATDYTDGLALVAIKNIFEYLPRAYENGPADIEAREKMANASTNAGMAFANALLGISHSMAHKLSAYYNLPLGISNALMIEHVMKYNADPAPTKLATSPLYPYPKAAARYAEIGRVMGLQGETDEEVLDKLIAEIAKLKERVGIKKNIKEYGIKEADFMATLDEMTANAFNDQRVGANPRYPLIKELKEIYLKAYHGK